MISKYYGYSRTQQAIANKMGNGGGQGSNPAMELTYYTASTGSGGLGKTNSIDVYSPNANWNNAADEIDANLPAEYRILLVRGTPADSLPVVYEKGAAVPARGTAVAFVERTPGVIALPSVFTEQYTIERAWIKLRDNGPAETYGLSRGWTLGSFLARRAAPSGIVIGERYGGKSCLAVDGAGPADHLTGADKKLLWLPVLHPPGTSLDTWWRLR
jgi:hypothetical protein